MNVPDLFHAIKIDTEKCIGCAHCMKVCPTEAIRILNGKAILNVNRCVDCGECFKVCPVDAYSVEDDRPQEMFQFDYRVALLPSVFFGQFHETYSVTQVRNVLHDIGFTHIYEIEAGIDLLSTELNAIVADKFSAKPVISSFCPAVVRLIRIEYPSLVNNIATLKAPADIAALYYKEKLAHDGMPKDKIGVFYVTPCAAKIAAIKNPIGESKSTINGVINLNTFYNLVHQGLENESKASEARINKSILNDTSIRWPLTNGEAKNVAGRTLSIDGIRNVMEFLEKVETEGVDDIDFLELRACDESCAGGILNCENRFLAVERLNNRARKNRLLIETEDGIDRQTFDDLKPYLEKRLHLTQPITPRPSVYGEDFENALKKMTRARELMCYLPGIDCGACGSPTCQSLAQDIVTKKANISHCIFMQRQMEKQHKLSPEHAFKIIEKVWGESRLDKDCSKKGAKNEIS